MAATTEAYFPLASDREAYVRALATYRPSAQQKGDYAIPGSAIIDLFAGVRTDAWDFGLFARNVLDEEVTLNDPASLATQPGLEIREGGFGSGYKAVNYRRGRELGVSLRYAFGVG